MRILIFPTDCKYSHTYNKFYEKSLVSSFFLELLNSSSHSILDPNKNYDNASRFN